jgi:predicted DNA-binding transcriptional regulator YafY
MEYTGGTRGTAPREVTPRAFVQRGGTAYLVAFCHLDSAEKSFRLDRVRSYEVVAPRPGAPAPGG